MPKKIRRAGDDRLAEIGGVLRQNIDDLLSDLLAQIVPGAGLGIGRIVETPGGEDVMARRGQRRVVNRGYLYIHDGMAGRYIVLTGVPALLVVVHRWADMGLHNTPGIEVRT